eukprot:CAMPEP_0205800676 /NCGR_PEP_ID=MMETSP0205-20121125/2411_1 /ASSEMBLY_ACC=CAM_ASM_000278 /TAXON_ID=36767 /ORGANISM="Euplotes focardii, Strain TN1" /LENGTH=305 /DNA_ID=CAMNT_0053064155 /DNA_START=415 /DNA_END=1329 /DNA_ORIENTATION=-
MNVFSSQKSKPFFLQNTGITSVGINSTKKQSKISEDFDVNFNKDDSISRKFVPPSPVVKLNKRIPKKETSKTSSKKSKKKGGKRVPRKYTKPNLSKEKVSNKSLVDNQNEQDDLLEANNPEENKRTSFATDLKAKEEKKSNTRFTLSNNMAVGMDKQGIIFEDQNEYDSEEDSDSDDSSEGTVSSVKSKEGSDSSNSYLELPAPMPFLAKKAVSENVPMMKHIENDPNDVTKDALSKYMKKDGSKKDLHPCESKDSTFLAPLPPIDMGRVRSISQKEPHQVNKSGNESSKSKLEFFTDLDLLRNG